MNPTDQLRDIQGLDPVSWFPLAPGWWLILAIMVLTAIVIYAFLFIRKTPRRTTNRKQENHWRRAALAELNIIMNETTVPPQQAMRLIVLLRQVAIYRYGREQCAGLSGRQWIAWLTEHDPKGFDWTPLSWLLTESHYMPNVSATSVEAQQVETLYHAIKAWIEIDHV